MSSTIYCIVVALVMQVHGHDRQEGTDAEVDQQSEDIPASVVYVRLSRDYVAEYVERNVDRKKPVRDLILGTRIAGESRTIGKTRLILHPSDRRASAEIEFTGTVHSRTIGRNGPATLHYLSDSRFRARKRIVIGEEGLVASPAVAEAPTRLTPTRIETNLPWLRGKIVERIAWRRVAKTRAEADAIASDHTADDIRGDLDRKVDASVAALQNALRFQIAELKLDGKAVPLAVRSRSTEDYVEAAVCRRDAPAEQIAWAQWAVEGSPDIAVRVHRAMMARAFSEPQLRERFAPVLASVVQTALAKKANAVHEQAEAASKTIEWSMGNDWLAVDFTKADAVEVAPRVAMNEEPTRPRKR